MEEYEKLIALKVLGITRSEVQPGAYALLLENADSTPDEARRIPIVVGAAEAQSIAVHMEQVVPSRPLTHDLFVSLFHAYGIELKQVVIYSFKDGVFAAKLFVTNGPLEVQIDSRTSDAIAIALRTGAPVFTTPELRVAARRRVQAAASRASRGSARRQVGAPHAALCRPGAV